MLNPLLGWDDKEDDIDNANDIKDDVEDDKFEDNVIEDDDDDGGGVGVGVGVGDDDDDDDDVGVGVGDIVLPGDLVLPFYCSADTRGKEAKEMISVLMIIIISLQ